MRGRGQGRATAHGPRVLVAAVMALGMVVVQPSPARADVFGTTFFPSHWGPNPWVSVPPTNPWYRWVAVIDNTGDPEFSAQIQTFVQIINHLHNNYNVHFPVFTYHTNTIYGGDPCGLGPAHFLIVCKEEALGGSGSPAVPGSASIFAGPQDHIFYAVARIRPSVTNGWCAGDRFTLVVQLLSNTLGLDQNLTNPDSALFPTIPVGRCSFNGWTPADLDRMNQIYNHLVG